MKNSRGYLFFALAMLVLAGPGCATKTPSVAMDAPVAEAAAGWVRTELYFSIGDWTETALSTEGESRWAEFLDREVTSRFPDGLSVIDVYGQWRSPKPASPILRERSRLLVVLHPATKEAADKVEAIRTAWKQLTGEESVLRVSQPAEVAF
ncbi:MAG: hypothetical protein K0R17_2528 [Rariglobus sp.]|jgi:hypothetical protein|nr:hypothetical protein [Rariglobus sp.]